MVIIAEIDTVFLASSAATALAAANAFVNLGLKAVGYEYINTDDTWSKYEIPFAMPRFPKL